jgi:gamma-glutamyl-gamma-aminobutyrate hydrolase PuuD
MKAVVISQRVMIDPRHGERRDCLDQRWSDFLLACGLVGIPLSNRPGAAQALLDAVAVAGVVLTGGNDLAVYGGDAPERDAAENELIDLAERRGLPVVGVCRGMQVLQHRHGVPLERVEGHVASRQTVRIDGRDTDVNSYHGFGTRENRPPLDVWAIAADGVIKAVRHPGGRMVAMMWHPERLAPFADRDIVLFREFFGQVR